MWEKINKYIAMEDLKNGYIYEIKARNANYGVWIEEKYAFIISRWKFSNNYLFYEYHWDKDEQFGTVKPMKLLSKFEFDLKDINEYNNSKEKEILKHLDSLDDTLINTVHKGYNEIQQERVIRKNKGTDI